MTDEQRRALGRLATEVTDDAERLACLLTRDFNDPTVLDQFVQISARIRKAAGAVCETALVGVYTTEERRRTIWKEFFLPRLRRAVLSATDEETALSVADFVRSADAAVLGAFTGPEELLAYRTIYSILTSLKDDRLMEQRPHAGSNGYRRTRAGTAYLENPTAVASLGRAIPLR